MNEPSQHHDAPELEGPLESAVWAVLGESIPRDAVARVKLRAMQLEATNEQISGEVTNRNVAVAPPSFTRQRWMKFGAPLVIAASVLVIASMSLVSPSVSLADVVSSSFAQRWVHGVTKWYSPQVDKAEGNANLHEETVVSESWYSDELEITSAQFADQIYFQDRRADISLTYKVGADTVIKTLPVPEEMRPLDAVENPLEQLKILASDQNQRRFVVKGLTTKPIRIDNRSTQQVSFKLVQRGNPLGARDIVMTIDDDSKLLVSLKESYANGTRSETVFDYPDSGPTDMIAAGVPESAVVVDRRASTDVREVASKWKLSRLEFDDYDAIVVQVPDGLSHSVVSGLNTSIKRVRRSGNRYRVDMLLTPNKQIEPPSHGADMEAWWNANRENYWSVPTLICDGSTIAYYKMVDGRIRKDQKPNLKVELRNQHPVHGVGEDRPVAWPHLMPEYAARPHLWLSDGKRRFEYSPTPNDGPKDSVRLVVTKPGESTHERHRYWLDPNFDLCMCRMVQPVFHSKASSPSKAGEVAYVDTEDLLDFKQSPSGKWFPTRVERITTTSNRKQIRTFHVNFDVKLQQKLFEPLDLEE